MSELFTSLPRQVYCHVERRHLGVLEGVERCSWFGLTSVPGRAWGLTLMLESGALYSHVPPNALLFDFKSWEAMVAWPIERAQIWDCFGYQFAVHEYAHLAGRDVWCRWPKHRGVMTGSYLFTAQHFGDGYSLTPEQAKQYHFIALANGRLTALPANHVLVKAPEFTNDDGWPKWLRRQTEVYTCE